MEKAVFGAEGEAWSEAAAAGARAVDEVLDSFRASKRPALGGCCALEDAPLLRAEALRADEAGEAARGARFC